MRYVVEQEATTQGIKMSRGVDPVFVTKQEIVILPRAKPIIAQDVPMVVKIRYSEPRLNQQSGNIVRGDLRDWNKRICNVNRVPRPNPQRCTYYHQIGHKSNECPFIENSARQRFVEHFQNQNPKPTRVENHGYSEPKELYHERVKILDTLLK
jgi:hypothetical protein